MSPRRPMKANPTISSRDSFCPGVGIDEDPVTGSSFADLAPYWCDRFDLESVVGFQASKRGGFMRAIQTLSSVRLLGQVSVYLRGELDSSLARLHNRIDEHPEAPKRKKRRARTVKQLPAIFEEPLIPGLEPAAATPPPPTSHPAPPKRRAAAATYYRDRRRRSLGWRKQSGVKAIRVRAPLASRSLDVR